MLKGKTIILGVTGGIAAYKAAALCSALIKQHATVHVVMTKNATEFVAPLTFETLSQNPVSLDTFDHSRPYEVGHVSLADQADLLVIAPATANILAKAANGIADDMLSTTILACDCPKMAVPAMNTRMYENPVTQDNLAKLRNYGWEILEPATGRLACGVDGKGKMPEPEDILEAIIHKVSHKWDMLGKHIVVSAGATQEALDPVRYLTNHSTGKMGYAIASAAAARGARVTLVSGATNLKKPAFVETVDIISASDMYDAITAQAASADAIIMAAAVADYRPTNVADEKIKKTSKVDMSSIPLERTSDILGFLGENKKAGQILCGFSMETENLLENSRVKLAKKNLDLIAANSLRQEGAGFGTETNVLTIITKDKEIPLPLMSKRAAADALLDEILALM